MQNDLFPYSSLPGFNRLFRDYLENYPTVNKFFPLSAGNPKEKLDHLPVISPLQRNQLHEILKTQNPDYHNSSFEISQILSEKTFTVLTGQQVGILGGPLYSLYKALTAVLLAKKWNQEFSEFQFLPIFWMELEDHDYSEVDHIHLFGKDGKIGKFQIPSSQRARRPVGTIELSSGIIDFIRTIRESLPSTDFTDSVFSELERFYYSENTYGKAFAGWLKKLVPELILFDPSDLRAKKLVRSVFKRTLEEGLPIRSVIDQRNKDLITAGYSTQVTLKDDQTLLFLLTGDNRDSLYRDDQGYFIKDPESKYAPEILNEWIDSQPERFSPNVLLRPIVQDWIFPTFAYIGGPSEIAYFAQVEVLYRHFQLPMPVLIPRGSITLVEGGTQKNITKYGLKFESILFRKEKWIEETIRSNIHSGSSDLLTNLGKLVESGWKELEDNLIQIDPTMAEAGKNSFSKIQYQIENLKTKVLHAEQKKNSTIVQQLSKISDLIYPQEKYQERFYNIVQYLNRYGWDFIGSITSKIDIQHLDQHQVLYL